MCELKTAKKKASEENKELKLNSNKITKNYLEEIKLLNLAVSNLEQWKKMHEEEKSSFID